jgi:RHH-type transcriptional regulator, proline utilization regulon repressor / proline dehydrogenase / delta 1-pyrroline-5-carboxylate dehydrogenase
MNLPFRNEPLRDFAERFHRDEIGRALAALDNALKSAPIVCRPVVDGTERDGIEVFDRRDPSVSSVSVSEVHFAGADLALEAIDVSRKALANWRDCAASDRSAIMRKAGEIMIAKKAELTALVIRESGKPWREADADVAEAIDFCVYYALLNDRMAHPRLTERVLGESNHYFYQPRGVVAVIAPWNFPLAIACGMAAAALVTGNTVLLKPAEQTSAVAQALFQIFREAGVPGGVLALLPGRGEIVGRTLVESPYVDMIVFTGSRDVGLGIIRAASDQQPEQRSIKRVVAELGGKNAIVIDDDADMDDAVRGVLSSAFGYSGQKCSACSRVLIVGDLYDPFVDRLAKATRDLLIGRAFDPATFVGPVIDTESFQRIQKTIRDAESAMQRATAAELPRELAGTGNFIAPTVLRECPFDHPVWMEEIFGPVVACARIDSFEAAVAEVNRSQYALTGGVFSRSPKHLEFARNNVRVGNLYLNRGITGALVGRQPFGGFGLSGVGSKAGGPDYLLQFVEPRVVTENTMRRGFSPDL